MKRQIKIVMTSGTVYFIIYDKVTVGEDGFDYFYNICNDEEVSFFRVNTKFVESSMRLLEEIKVDVNNPDNWVRTVGYYD